MIAEFYIYTGITAGAIGFFVGVITIVGVRLFNGRYNFKKKHKFNRYEAPKLKINGNLLTTDREEHSAESFK